MKQIVAVALFTAAVSAAHGQPTCPSVGNNAICSDSGDNSLPTQERGLQDQSGGAIPATLDLGQEPTTSYSDGKWSTSQQAGQAERTTNSSDGGSPTQQLGNEPAPALKPK